MVTWDELLDVFKKFAALPAKSREQQAIAYASAFLDCTASEIETLSMAFNDNVSWIRSSYRSRYLADACANPKLKTILKKLFVLDLPTEFTYLADGVVIAEKAGEYGGLNWKRTPKIVRIRKNGIMNWGTEDTVYNAEKENETQYSEPVILVPEANLARNVVFYNSDKLTKVCTTFKKLNYKAGFQKGKMLPFWGSLFVLACAVLEVTDEHECLTYSPRVKCNVFLVNRRSLIRNKWHTAKAPRLSVTSEE